MKYEERVPEELFEEDGHYLGRPADFDDRIISRRVRLIREIPNYLGKKYSLLEIGCGNGASMFQVAHDLKSCTGIEVTREHEDQFDNYVKLNNISNCEYEISDVVTEKAKKQYDRIISFEVIEHLSDESGLKFYHDSLKDEGLMAISVPNKWWIFETHGAKLPLLPWNRVPFFSWLPRPIHERFANARIYTKSRISKLLDKYGFEVMDIQYVTAPMDVLPKGKIRDWIINNIFNTDTTQIPFKGVSIFVVARKKM